MHVEIKYSLKILLENKYRENVCRDNKCANDAVPMSY